MSATNENRWRHSGSQTRNTPGRGGPNSPKTQQPPSQQQQQQRGTGGNKGQQSQKSNSNQANADRSRSTSGFKGHGKSQSATINNVTSGAAAGQTANHSRGANALQEVKHVPVKGFNSWETKEYLKKNYADGLAGGELHGERESGADGKVTNPSTADIEQKSAWKPATDAAPIKPNAWGAKPSNMATGQDFWVQLSKQIAALEQARGG